MPTWLVKHQANSNPLPQKGKSCSLIPLLQRENIRLLMTASNIIKKNSRQYIPSSYILTRAHVSLPRRVMKHDQRQAGDNEWSVTGNQAWSTPTLIRNQFEFTKAAIRKPFRNVGRDFFSFFLFFLIMSPPGTVYKYNAGHIHTIYLVLRTRIIDAREKSTTPGRKITMRERKIKCAGEKIRVCRRKLKMRFEKSRSSSFLLSLIVNRSLASYGGEMCA